VIAVDTSVVVAAFASWHEGHEGAAAALARRPRIPVHVLIETYSVLTRLPAPHRAPADLVVAFLEERFAAAGSLLTLPPRDQMQLIQRAAAAGLLGGSVHDALVAATAQHAGARLLTRDRRARLTYVRLGIDYELLP
jgi:predicted nucleic acid-binding protein